LEWITAHGLAASADLAALREAVAATDRVRRVRLPPEAVLSAWRALHRGCWSIVASVERDGQRLLVARPNAPLRSGAPPASTEAASRRRPESPRRLSAQESRVLAALAKGHTNKVIAYDLDLATSTVSTLLARAARKLGCKTRIELARVGGALTRQSASQQRANVPA
jgi:DNA-binding NarL/FixJ family response regulator